MYARVMREQAGVWHHIHLVYCCNTTQLLAAALETGEKTKARKREEKFECVSEKGRSVPERF